MDADLSSRRVYQSSDEDASAQYKRVRDMKKEKWLDDDDVGEHIFGNRFQRPRAQVRQTTQEAGNLIVAGDIRISSRLSERKIVLQKCSTFICYWANNLSECVIFLQKCPAWVSI
ncbi:MAG: hypothetical protein GY832_26425 [Chloroflexi bacterium]|nr:hypothetical protein [Chloroflexota bacterium]